MVSSPSKLIMDLLNNPANWDLQGDLGHGNVEFISGPRTDGARESDRTPRTLAFVPSLTIH